MTAQQLRKSILQMAVQGKLVPQDPSDEPAHVLLERIRAEKERLIKEKKIKKEKNSSVIYRGTDNLHYEKFADGTVKCIKDEIPFEIPQSWAWERLSNIAAFSGGKTPSTSHPEYWGSEVPWVTSKDMKSKYIKSSQLCLSILGSEQLQAYSPNTILLVVRSGILRHTLPVSILKISASVNQDLKAISLYLPELAEYIYICLKGLESNILRNYTKSGTTVQNINFDDFKNILLPIAPSQQIDRIISRIEKVMLHIQQYEVAESQLLDLENRFPQNLKRSVLQSAVQGKLVPQDENDEPASVLLERIQEEKKKLIKDGKLKKDKHESVIFGRDNSYYERLDGVERCIDDEIPFEIPKSWVWVRLGNIGCWRAGATPNRTNPEFYNGNIPWLKTGDLTDTYIISIPESITKLALEKTNIRLNPAGSILIAMYGATIGKLGILTFPATTNQACCACTPLENVDGMYLFYFLMSHRSFFLKSGEGGAQSNISKEKIISTLMPLPPLLEQKRIASTLKQILFLTKAL